MEKTGRITMVSGLKWSIIETAEIAKAEYRFEASVFKVESKRAELAISQCKFPKLPLIGTNGFVKNAHYGGRAKRNYIPRNNKDAIGFLGSAEMLQLRPKPEKYILDNSSADKFRLKKNTVLISRSGTIGNLTFVSDTLAKYFVSEHAIRLEQCEFPGYIYSFLKSSVGQHLIESKIYGAVVDQIEPEHLANILVPNPSTTIKRSINDKIIKSFQLRDESNELIDEAERMLIKILKLPQVEEISPSYFNKSLDFQNFSIKLNHLDNRFDASYHIPLVNAIIDILLDNASKILPLGSEDLTLGITLPGRFKRDYVEEGEGAVFLGGKQIYELDPCNKKYLSIKKHKVRIENQFFLNENMIVVTRSGTIGKVNLIPEHWKNWIMSEHVLRAIPISDEVAGYLYIWLNSDYGRLLIERYTYGAVIDEIAEEHLAKIPVPLIKDKTKMREISEMALMANKLRSQAFYLERSAIEDMVKKVIMQKV